MTNKWTPEPPAELKLNHTGDAFYLMIDGRDYLNIIGPDDSQITQNRCKRLADAWNGTRDIPHPEKVPELVDVLKSFAKAGHRPAIAALKAAGVDAPK